MALVRNLTSMQRKGGERTKVKFSGKHVRIWSAEWRAWWRPKAQGYTGNIEEAGVFPFDDAWARSHHCGPEKRISYHEAPTPPSRGEGV